MIELSEDAEAPGTPAMAVSRAKAGGKAASLEGVEGLISVSGVAAIDSVQTVGEAGIRA